MKGSITCTSAITMAVSLYSSLTGPMPTALSTPLIRPSGPSSMLQPNARTTTEISSGARMTSRKIERHGLPIRLRM